MFNESMFDNPKLNEVFYKTSVIRKPISGIVSDYHELPYVLVTPDDKNPDHSIEVNGSIKVSPRFVLSPSQLGDSFGEVFDPETFDKEIQARLFSFVYSRRKNLKLSSTGFTVSNFEEKADEHLNRVHDVLLKEENIRTGLIFGPMFRYYPVSIDRFIREIVDREFSV
jgi:hypothetical protein